VRLTAERRELERNNVGSEMHANPGRVSAIGRWSASSALVP
jgi:hypothetical protein